MKKYSNIFALVALLLPGFVFAAPLTGLKALIEAIGALTKTSIIVLAGLSLLVFFWGLVKFIFHVSGDEKAIEEGKRIMKWGLIALFVMVSVWGIIKFMQVQLEIKSTTPPPPPVVI
ncbi:MAG: hypothetical protein Q7R69_03500 [bacterium]|nr:hypothetical protein [bacterium]